MHYFHHARFFLLLFFLVVMRAPCYAPAWPFAMGCSPHVKSHSPREAGVGRADVGVSGILPHGANQSSSTLQVLRKW